MTREEKRQRKAIWESMRGCDCPLFIDGKLVPRTDRCTFKIVRCNGRLSEIHNQLEAAGLPFRAASPPPITIGEDTKGQEK